MGMKMYNNKKDPCYLTDTYCYLANPFPTISSLPTADHLDEV